MNEALIKFALWTLNESRDHSIGDVDGGALQDKAEALGLLVRVPVSEPCGEDCTCAEYGDFPQECLRYADEVRALIVANNVKAE